MRVQDIPVILNVRDRVTDLRNMVTWLETAGQKDIRLFDNASTYPPLLEYLETQGDRVHYLGVNLGRFAVFADPPPPPFFYSDPDLVFLCQYDGLEYLHWIAQRYPAHKVGFGLTLAGVPETMPSLEWERLLQSDERQLEPGLYDAPIDTTFALYMEEWPSGNAIRTGRPYVMMHPSWYVTRENISEEDRYYLDHVEGSSCSWATWF